MIGSIFRFIIAGTILLVVFILKSMLVLGVSMIPGMVINKALYKIKLVPLGMIVSTLFFINKVFTSNIKSIRVLSVIMIIGIIANLNQWFKSTKNKSIRTSKIFEEEQSFIISIYIIEMILMHNISFDKFVSFKTESTILMILIAIATPVMLNTALKYYDKIKNIIKENGLIKESDLYAIVKSDHSNEDDVAKKFNKVLQLLENIMIHEEELIEFKGKHDIYYFRKEKYIKLNNCIRNIISNSKTTTLENIKRDIDVEFSQLDLKVFLLDEMSDVVLAHYDNKIVYTLTSDENQIEGVCECCRKYGSIIINNNYGMFCSQECMDIMLDVINDVKSNNYSNDIIKFSTVGALNSQILSVLEKQQYYVNKYKVKGDASHGFAAEVVNTDIDNALGKNSSLDGIDNSLNGADRCVNGINVQSKYCATARKSVEEAFGNQGYRYINADGTPMELEVPKDQYNKSVEIMREKISKGEVPGVEDVAQAEEIVRPGYLTLNQAKNITKFGTIESVVYDFSQGAVIGLNTFGISSTIVFAVQIWNGNDIENAFNSALNLGIESAVKVTASSVISSQLAKTTTSKLLVKKFGQGVLKLNNNVVTLAVFQYKDFVDFFGGYMSGKELTKKVIITGSSFVAGAKAGSMVGGVPGAAVGALVGGAVGATVNKAINQFSKSDAQEMQMIFEGMFEILAREYLLTNDEIKRIYNNIYANDDGRLLKEMYKADDRYKFASHIIIPQIGKCYKKRSILAS